MEKGYEEEHLQHREKRSYRLNDFFHSGGSLANWKSDNWLCLDSYALLGEKYGWDSYRRLLALYYERDDLRNTALDDTRYY